MSLAVRGHHWLTLCQSFSSRAPTFGARNVRSDVDYLLMAKPDMQLVT